MRKARVERKTKETRVRVEVDLDGTGKFAVRTGIDFFDHMLEQVAAKSLVDVKLEAECVDRFDEHHLVEDAGIALGQALSQALGDRNGINRYGFFVLPMDESLALCALDLSGRGKLAFEAGFPAKKVGDLSAEMVEHFFEALATNLGCTLQLRLLAGRNSHHIAEALFKSFGKAWRMAVEPDARMRGVPSTKGRLREVKT